MNKKEIFLGVILTLLVIAIFIDIFVTLHEKVAMGMLDYCINNSGNMTGLVWV